MKKTIPIMVLLLMVLISTAAAQTSKATGSSSPRITISLVNQDPDPAVVGDVVEIRLGVTNTGGQALSDVTVGIEPEYPLSQTPGGNNTKVIGTVQAYQGAYNNNKNTQVVKFSLMVERDALAGMYPLTIWYSVGSSSARTEQTLNINVRNEESAQIIHIDKSLLIPGKQSPLTFIIENVGNAPLHDLTFSWENPEKIILPVGSDNTRHVKYIDLDESADISYEVIADTSAVAGLYSLKLYLTYAEGANSSTKTVTTTAGVYVGGETDFDVAFSESTSGQISFSIANIGSNPANSVSIRVPEQPAWRVNGPNSVIIGNLNKGDYTVASFRLQSTAQNRTGMGSRPTTGIPAEYQRPMNASRNFSMNTLTLNIAYTDTMGERRIVEKQVPINPQNLAAANPLGTNGRTAPTPGFFSKYKWYFLIAILLIGGYYGYRRYQAYRKKTTPLHEHHVDLKAKPKR